MTENSSAEAEAQSIHTRLMALFNESWKYFLVSAASLALDLMVYWTLIRILGVHYLIANIISVGSGLVLNYLLSIAFVFKQRRLKNRRAEFIGFVLIGLAGLVVNEWLVALFVGMLGFGVVPGKVAAAGGSFVFNFVARKLLLFTGTNPAAAPSDDNASMDADRA